MKKVEIILGAMIFTGLGIDLFLIPGGHLLLFLSLTSLSVFYFFSGFVLFNGIGFRQIFTKSAYKGKSMMRVVGAILVGYALAITLIGILFAYKSWAGGTTHLRVGLFLLLIALTIGVVKYARNKSAYYSQIFRRIGIYGALGLTFLLLPRHTWLEIKYANYPAYVEAVKRAMAEPNNPELSNKADQERIKMYQDWDK
jgi:hypothetical protein